DQCEHDEKSADNEDGGSGRRLIIAQRSLLFAIGFSRTSEKTQMVVLQEFQFLLKSSGSNSVGGIYRDSNKLIAGLNVLGLQKAGCPSRLGLRVPVQKRRPVRARHQRDHGESSQCDRTFASEFQTKQPEIESEKCRDHEGHIS